MPFKYILDQGAWIAEWYHTRLWSLLRYAMPWAVISSLSDDKLFFGPKHNIYALFMILFGLFVWYYYLSVKFVMWIVKQKIENKIKLFLKKYVLDHLAIRVSIEV